MARGDETEVRAYDGEVESLTSASSSGLGIRVITDHRLGFAWAGSLDEEVLGPTLDEARDNAEFATPDEHVRLAVPDGVAPVAVDLWDAGLASVPTTAKVELAPRARSAGPRAPIHASARSRAPTTGTPRSRSRSRLDHRHLGHQPQDVGVRLGRGDRRRRRRQPDR